MAGKSNFTDEQLMDLADEIKAKYKGKELTPSLLERETGIGRMTWKRRIDDYLNELNKPLVRDMGENTDDTILFPSIETIFTRHGYNVDKHVKLINALHELELLIQDLHKENQLNKEQSKKYEKIKDSFEEQSKKIQDLKSQKQYYETKYNQLVVSSLEAHLRKEHGISADIINFNSNKKIYEKLDTLEENFSEPKETSSQKKINELENNYGF
ncbi:hypothetical protein [Paenibacillus macquariensis]|uniref:Uncharacterized protein n=1 Tax=Paenibacillus macquariensis TaxID=948756 RepID=A0ABY1JW05_9BACL|nr:hypothetical protein [Paenibacillus macquariensis]MEC0093471.1 hypothetical protein [Paenibacillus macquariensis]OAB34395.1 hypothetical protein PMSM_10985 [Paenibacillus macquariensis subsp. macquariensis]SIQ87477.1 hypothetical protein SAMN05421578_104438 [Paenibacillus macquariensis]